MTSKEETSPCSIRESSRVLGSSPQPLFMVDYAGRNALILWLVALILFLILLFLQSMVTWFKACTPAIPVIV
jgi:hypothetical protein